MSVNVTIKNQTTDYAFYVGPIHEQKIAPDTELIITLTNHDPQVFAFDRNKNPTPWKTFGLGNGGMIYSIIEAGQCNFFIMLGPAPDGPQDTPAPMIEVSGAVTGKQQGDWLRGINLSLQGSPGDQIIVTITE